jgi:hypothetical protein
MEAKFKNLRVDYIVTFVKTRRRGNGGQMEVEEDLNDDEDAPARKRQKSNVVSPSLFVANCSNRKQINWKKRLRKGLLIGQRFHWMRFTNVGSVIQSLARTMVIIVELILPMTSITPLTLEMLVAGLSLFLILLLLTVLRKDCGLNLFEDLM